ncbi:UPF0149 family protein [Nitrincola sp. MINF-07-Sa-05]|uniref:UPF0149 family protein n=1 Tax=Nitrincola salilacus TaxID=3400273 RepID=UPI003917F159
MTDDNSSIVQLPDFDTLANNLIEEGVLTVSPSELHGILAGHLAAGARFDPDTLLRVVAELMDLDILSGEKIKLILLELYQITLAQLQSTEFSLQLLMPDDVHQLEQRADALGDWCSGFLSGFGLYAARHAQLSEEVTETLHDLAQIAQIAAESEAAGDEDEADLMEVYEYVRMAALLVFTECNPEPDEPGKQPVLH